MNKIAIVQSAPVFLDKKKSIALAVDKIAVAAAQGAELVLFSEAFIPGYPAWIWRLKPGGDWNLNETLHAQLLSHSVSLNSNDLDPLYAAAKKHQVTVLCGINERDDQLSQSTLYNSFVIIGADGNLLNKHRKIMPTNPERMVWGFGDASGLKVVETPVGRIGGLMCWENYMPLARYALYAQGIELYIAPTYDSGEGWLGSLQHIAREGRCWVLGCGNLLQASDIPDDFPEKDRLYPDPDEWVNPGDSVVIAPGGEIVAGPMREQSGILYFDVDRAKVAASRRTLDVCGHYSRPDIFQLNINTQQQSPVTFDE